MITRNTKRKTTDMFINDCINTIGYLYDYSLVKYINSKKKVKIICNIHGIFEQTGLFEQSPNSHLYGVGCPNCQESKGEREIRKILEENNIEYINQYSFNDCRFKNRLRFDFYLPTLNTCIEFDGLQHFKPIKHYGGEKDFKVRLERDKIKSKFCNEKNINLLRIRFDENIKNKLLECLL